MPAAKRKKQKPELHPADSTSAIQAQEPPWKRSHWPWLAALVVLVLIQYWVPLTGRATIQWDAADYHYPVQKYFGDRILHGELPFWTPYVESGYPFLADIQVGAWYPLNWPFFLAGITPRAIQAELALHALLAAAGAFLLLYRLVPHRPAALVGALAYAMSGFFVEHSSHAGMFCGAALLPWLLLCFDRALERNALRYGVFGGMLAAGIILAGHFQTALYSLAALTLFAAARLWERRDRIVPGVSVLAGIGILAVLLSAIQTWPGLELTAATVRSSANFSNTRDRVLELSALANYVYPNLKGVFDHPDGSGITDQMYYLYSGFLLIPLAVAGAVMNRRLRPMGACLAVIPLWYMLGPVAGLYRLGAVIPFFHSVRAPVQGVFVPALGLAILAAAGSAWIFSRFRMPWLLFALPLLFFADVFYWNSLNNPLAYAHFSWEESYGGRESIGAQQVAATQPPLTRYSMPDRLTVFGPLAHALDLKLEATYGYTALELETYLEYHAAEQANPKLTNGLNVTRVLNMKTATLDANPDALPRAYFARRVISVADRGASKAALATLDPAEAAIVEGPAPAVQWDPSATVATMADGEQGYRIRYRAAVPSLLKIAVPYFPGWSATVGGRQANPVRIDHALMGLVVPAGEQEVVLRFHSTRFAAGAGVTGAALAICIGALVVARRRQAAA